MTRSLRGIIAVSAVAVLFAVSPAAAKDYQTLDRADAVATVNGSAITKGQLEEAMNNLLPLMTYHSSVSDERYMMIQKKALNSLLETEAVYEYAKQNKLDKVDKKELDQAVADVRKNVPQGETLESILKNSGMTMDDLRERFKKERVITRITADQRERLEKKAKETVTEDYMKDYYNNNKEKFLEPARFHLRSILVKADPGGGARVWNESKRKAEEILKRAKSGDFAELAKEFSEDPNAALGGDMGWAHTGSLYEEIENAIKEVEVGGIVGPVMTIHGYHVLKVEGRKPSVQKAFESLDLDRLKAELEEKEFKTSWVEWMADLRKAAKIEYLVESLK